MSDHSDAMTNQTQTDSRANLFYFLQELAELKQGKDRGARVVAEILDEQIETYQKQNGTLL